MNEQDIQGVLDGAAAQLQTVFDRWGIKMRAAQLLEAIDDGSSEYGALDIIDWCGPQDPLFCPVEPYIEWWVSPLGVWCALRMPPDESTTADVAGALLGVSRARVWQLVDEDKLDADSDKIPNAGGGQVHSRRILWGRLQDRVRERPGPMARLMAGQRKLAAQVVTLAR